MEGEGKTSLTFLPEELVEKILAMVPFPYVFKARALSKSWQARFEPILSQDDEEKKRLATSFQKHVGEWSTKWKTFSPVFISRRALTGKPLWFPTKDFISYDQGCQKWQTMPSLSFLPTQFYSSSNWQIEGALLLVIGDPKESVRTTSEFFVANILTQSWKTLPPPQQPKLEYGVTKMLIPLESMYKVVIFEDDFSGGNCVACAVQVYDSNLDAWSSRKKFSVMENFGHLRLSDWTNLNGVLYRVVRFGPHIDLGPPSDLLVAKRNRRRGGQPTKMTWGLLAFNVNEGTFEILEMGQTDLPLFNGNVGLTVCNGSLLMLVYDEQYAVAQGLIVLKIDPECRKWLEMTRLSNFGKFGQKPASDGNCIFFVNDQSMYGIQAYNVHKNKWTNIRCPWGVSDYTGWAYRKQHNAPRVAYQWYPFFFQPGLNPFGAV